MRLIDADAAKSKAIICTNAVIFGDESEAMITFASTLQNLLIIAFDEAPTIEAEPIIHARWEKVGVLGSEYRCTNCQIEISMYGSARTPDERGWYHCKRCGAKMDGESPCDQ